MDTDMSKLLDKTPRQLEAEGFSKNQINELFCKGRMVKISPEGMNAEQITLGQRGIIADVTSDSKCTINLGDRSVKVGLENLKVDKDLKLFLNGIKRNGRVAVLRMVGSYCPVTLAHVLAFEKARDCLLKLQVTRQGNKIELSHADSDVILNRKELLGTTEVDGTFDAVVGFMLLNTDQRLKDKLTEAGDVNHINFLNMEHRTMLVDKSIDSFDWLFCAGQYGNERMECDAAALQTIAREQLSDRNLTFVQFGLNGSDDVIKYSKWREAKHHICLQRPSHDVLQEMKHDSESRHVFITLPSVGDISATAARQMLVDAETDALGEFLHADVQKWCEENKHSPWKFPDYAEDFEDDSKSVVSSFSSSSICVGVGKNGHLHQVEDDNLKKIGIIADIQHGDPDSFIEEEKDKGGYQARFYRHTLSTFEKGMEHLNKEGADVMLLLGDLMEACDRTDRRKCDENFKSVLTKAAETFRDTEKIGLALGNHDVWSLEAKKLRFGREAPGRETDVKGALCYEFSRSASTSEWRFVVLDCMSAWRNKGSDDERTRGLTAHPSGRVGLNGYIGQKQLSWLENRLKEARLRKAKVCLFSHMPLSSGFSGAAVVNSSDVMSTISSIKDSDGKPCVRMIISGHTHKEKYLELDRIHHFTLKAALETDPKEMTHSAYILQLLDDHSAVFVSPSGKTWKII